MAPSKWLENGLILIVMAVVITILGWSSTTGIAFAWLVVTITHLEDIGRLKLSNGWLTGVSLALLELLAAGLWCWPGPFVWGVGGWPSHHRCHQSDHWTIQKRRGNPVAWRRLPDCHNPDRQILGLGHSRRVLDYCRGLGSLAELLSATKLHRPSYAKGHERGTVSGQLCGITNPGGRPLDLGLAILHRPLARPGGSGRFRGLRLDIKLGR